MTSEYFQLALNEESQDLRAFVITNGTPQVDETAQGLASVPEAFQNVMELIMAGLSYEVALVYLDDLIILKRSFDEHPNRLEFTLGRHKDAGLKIKGSRGVNVEV